MTLPSEDAILKLNHSSDLGFDAAQRVLKEMYEIDVVPLMAQLTEARLLIMGAQRTMKMTESWNEAALEFLWRTAPKEDECDRENKE